MKEIKEIRKGGEQMSAEVAHIPVALTRCLDLLTPAIANSSKPYLIDATLGLAGHAKVFLEKFSNLHLFYILHMIKLIKP
jgi:16S rRNA (cytosine1402-N4)-methyltransferase